MGVVNGATLLSLVCSCVSAAIAEEANEVTSDPQGRWFKFSITMRDVVIMEKKGMPNHLQSLPCCDTATAMEDVIRELEDAGEAHV